MKNLNNYLLSIFISLISFLLFGNIYSYYKIKSLKLNSYRSHDKYSTSKYRYKSNVNAVETQLYGDLCATSSLYENCYFSSGEREHTFKTDDLGYKTNNLVKESELAIIGDSFLAAHGGDNMEDQLGYLLSAYMGIKIYEAAFPGDMRHYVDRYLEVRKANENIEKYIFLIFEGNDLVLKDKNYNSKSYFKKKKLKESYKRPWHFLRPIYTRIIHMPLRKLIVTVIRDNRNKYGINASPNDINVSAKSPVMIKDFNFRKEAFLKVHNSNSLADDVIPMEDFLIENNKSICGLVFIPTKYSVYLDNKSTKVRHPSLNNQFNRLKKSGINVLDLTETFRKKVKEDNRYSLWWADDTHWNKNGISLAAKEIYENKICL